ncbi:hypothetical protein DL98DRAFT_540048 [Cadophora sp. DSE1049]|nr:hypothetical protein DL98DRAFT_540048 [Cadophora sp. DSE1049]
MQPPRAYPYPLQFIVFFGRQYCGARWAGSTDQWIEHRALIQLWRALYGQPNPPYPWASPPQFPPAHPHQPQQTVPRQPVRMQPAPLAAPLPAPIQPPALDAAPQALPPRPAAQPSTLSGSPQDQSHQYSPPQDSDSEEYKDKGEGRQGLQGDASFKRRCRIARDTRSQRQD